MKVFISYSRRDDGAVRSLVADLKRARVQAWIDEKLGGGDAWWTAILEQIRDCSVFIFALSNESLYSKPCRAELGYAKELGIPILPVQIGDVASYRIDEIFTVQLIDYRKTTMKSGIDLVSALHSRAAQRTDLPDPLPEPPPIPYEYLHRLGSSIHNTGVTLSPATQAHMLFELRSALTDEDDPIVVDDIRNLLRALRRRADVTYMIANEIDTLLESGAPTAAHVAAGENSDITQAVGSADTGGQESQTAQSAGAATPSPSTDSAPTHFSDTETQPSPVPPPPAAESSRTGQFGRNRLSALLIAAVVVVVIVGVFGVYRTVARTPPSSRHAVAPSASASASAGASAGASASAVAPSASASASAGVPSRLTQSITDNASTLTDSGRADVQSAIDKLYSDRGIRLWVVYVASFGAQGPVNWARSAIQSSDLGQKAALLAVAMDHAWALELRGTGLPQSKLDTLKTAMHNEIGPAVARSDYRGAALTAAQSLD